MTTNQATSELTDQQATATHAARAKRFADSTLGEVRRAAAAVRDTRHLGDPKATEQAQLQHAHAGQMYHLALTEQERPADATRLATRGPTYAREARWRALKSGDRALDMLFSARAAANAAEAQVASARTAARHGDEDLWLDRDPRIDGERAGVAAR